ncbi:MAG: hypothetical protein ACI4UL_05805, partial [Muribaculaceae bacterium]
MNYGNAPYVCEKGATSRTFCFKVSAEGNVLTVGMTSELTTLGEYELHLPAGFYTIDGADSTEELVFNYTIVETLGDGILREAPSGRRVECMTKFVSFFPDYGGDRLWHWYIYGKPTHYILGDDGNLYIFNPIVTKPFSNAPINSYIVAENVDGKYIAKFPQAIFNENFKGVDEVMYLNVGETANGTYNIVDAENNRVEFVIDGDILMAQLPNENSALAAFTEQGVWSYYANRIMEYHPASFTAVAPPSDGIPEDWVLTYNVEGGQYQEAAVRVIMTDTEMWINGLGGSYCSGLWAHGEIEDDKVYFDEYLGLSDVVGQYIFLYRAKSEEGSMEPLEFNYDAENKTLSLIGYNMLVNPNPWFPYALQYYENAVIKPVPEVELTTKTPKPVRAFDAFYPQSTPGMYAVQIGISSENTAGEVLKSSRLYFELLHADETPYVFTPENYPALTESFSLVPFNYQVTGVVGGHNLVRTFNVYLGADEDNLGARMVYIDDTGTYKSEILWAVQQGSGLDDIASAKECVSTEYYDISGR